ncbi:MAG: methyltransferase domain-containing protein [Alphaproteobacteria bacterium]|jgi:ubiquinone/menaquinone biosynthesis C-methylase UbiE|nr:methyltransferase domain-containing protein [Alphaproteobacteria bacterium]
MATYDTLADAYVRRRAASPATVEALRETGRVGSGSLILEVGAGTGNHSRALVEATGCRAVGLEPSRAMLGHARRLGGGVACVAGDAHALPFRDGVFDLVFSTDVIHHLARPAAHFREAARVLSAGGHLITVTQSHAGIRARPVLSRFFPETVAADIARYPDTLELVRHMAEIGFEAAAERVIETPRVLSDAKAYADKAFSALHQIPEAAFRAGLGRLEAALAEGPLPAPERASLVVGRKVAPGSVSA